jgi:hypothetical protein
MFFCTATERILKRLQEKDSTVAPPPLELIHAPLPILDSTILCHQQNFFYALRADFSALVDFAKYEHELSLLVALAVILPGCIVCEFLDTLDLT